MGGSDIVTLLTEIEGTDVLRNHSLRRRKGFATGTWGKEESLFSSQKIRWVHPEALHKGWKGELGGPWLSF